jgi:hypothetical protein
MLGHGDNNAASSLYGSKQFSQGTLIFIDMFQNVEGPDGVEFVSIGDVAGIQD